MDLDRKFAREDREDRRTPDQPGRRTITTYPGFAGTAVTTGEVES